MSTEISDIRVINLKRLILVAGFALVAYLLSSIEMLLCWLTAAAALVLSFRYAIISFKLGQSFVSMAYLALVIALITLYALPIWGGHQGWVSYHYHYLWQVGHIH